MTVAVATVCLRVLDVTIADAIVVDVAVTPFVFIVIVVGLLLLLLALLLLFLHRGRYHKAERILLCFECMNYSRDKCHVFV